NYAANASAADQAQTISPANTAVTVGSTTTGTVDQQVTLTATVAPATTPTVTTNDAVPFSGTIAFFSDGAAITGCGAEATTNNATDENATASCQTSALTASGSPHAITAEYNSGDPNYSASAQSASVGQTILPASTAVTVNSISPTTPTVDESVTITATVAPGTGSVIVPFAGTMAFYVGGTAISACAAQTVNTTTGAASCTDAAGLAAGSQNITAAYNTGDANYSASAQSANFPVTVSKAATKVTVTSVAPSAPTVDQTPTISATVAPSSGTSVGPFAGTMSFSVGGAAITGCTAQAVNTSTGVATCTDAAGLSVGGQNITATYSGDATYAASAQSANFPVTVGMAATRASVSPSPSTSNVDQSVTLTAVITANVSSNEVSTANIVAMTGNVSFSDSGTAITNCSSLGVSFSTATGTATAMCTTSALSAGTHSDILATYLGDPSYNSSPNSTPTTVTVSKASSTMTVTANPAAPTPNNPVTYTAAITFPNPLAITPGGTVAFSDNGTNISTCTAQPISVTGTVYIYQATCNVSSLTGGSHAIIATYSGDANYLSTIGTLSLSIGSASTTTTVLSSLNPSTVNAPVTFTVNVLGGTSVAVTGTATVTADGTNNLGQCTVSGWNSTNGT
ncbi:MAG: Ig-like domain repeat protein, partial [Terracidiphilus sp.]